MKGAFGLSMGTARQKFMMVSHEGSLNVVEYLEYGRGVSYLASHVWNSKFEYTHRLEFAWIFISFQYYLRSVLELVEKKEDSV